MPPWPLCKTHALPISEAIDEMVDAHPGRLHERVDDDGPHEAEPSPHQVLAYRLCLWTPQRNTFRVLEFVHYWFVAHIFPHVAAQRPTFSHNLHFSYIYSVTILYLASKKKKKEGSRTRDLMDFSTKTCLDYASRVVNDAPDSAFC